MDWNVLKAEYIAGGTSYRKLAKKYGVSFNTLKTIAIKEEWTALRQQANNNATTKIIEAITEDKTNNAVKINQVADKLLEKISDAIDSCDVLCSQSIKHLTSSLKDLKDIKGIKSEIDLREQEARIDKLRKDIEADNEYVDKPCGVVLMPPIMEKLTPPEGEDDDG